MKKEDLFRAVGEIDDFLIEQSEKNHNDKNNTLIWSTLAAAAFIAVGTGWLYTANHRAESKYEIGMNEQTIAESYIDIPTEWDNSPINYSELKISANKSDLDFSNVMGSASLDIIEFDESMLKNCGGIVEGEILNMRINEYHYKESFDKFGKAEIIDRCEYTVAYDILVDKVWYGDAEAGQTITIEEQTWWEDTIFQPAENHRCVIPYFCGSNEVFCTAENFIEGDIIKESPYQNIYGFQPQIEVTEDNCYIVPKTWKSFCNDRMRDIVMDIYDTDDEKNWWYECFGVGLVSAEDFESGMNDLINSYCNKNDTETETETNDITETAETSDDIDKQFYIDICIKYLQDNSPDEIPTITNIDNPEFIKRKIPDPDCFYVENESLIKDDSECLEITFYTTLDGLLGPIKFYMNEQGDIIGLAERE